MLHRMVSAASNRVKDDSADPEDLGELVKLRDDIATMMDEAIVRRIATMRFDGFSWKSIGHVLGTTGQAVYMRYGRAVEESGPPSRAS